MLLLGTLQLVIIVSICIQEFKWRSVGMILWGTLLLMFGIPHFISALTENTMGYSVKVMNISSLFVILFSIIYYVFRYVTRKKNTGSFILRDVKLDVTRNESGCYSFFVIIGFIFFITYIIYNFGNVFSTSWQMLHEQSRISTIYNSGSILYLLYYFSGYIIAAFDAVLVYYLLNKKILVSIVLVSLNVLWVIVSRTRANMIPLFVVLLMYILFQYKKIDRKLIKKLIPLVLLGVSFIYILQGIRLAGSLANFFNPDNFFNVIEKSVRSIFTSDSGGEFGLRDGFYYFIANNNSFPGFGKMKTYLSLIMLPFPSFMTFGLKPEDFAITMGRAYSQNYSIDYFSMHPTLFGDCYANLGFIGVIIGGFWALFISFMEKKINSTASQLDRMGYILACSTCLFLIGRGAVYYGCRMMFIKCMMIWLVRRIFFKLNLKKI